MLGWEIYINRLTVKREFDLMEESLNDDTLLATWITGIDGLNWINALVKEGKAEFLGGCGYPQSFSAKADVLIPKIYSMPRNYKGTTIIGDDYVHLGGFNKDMKINQSRIDECSPNEILRIEEWD